MKKIIIGVIILLLLILGYFMCFKGISIGKIKFESIKDIKSMSNKLDVNLEEANKVSAQTYPKEINNLENAEKNLNKTKTEYDSKSAYATANQNVFVTYDRKYKIETLMVDLGRHSKQNGLKDLRLDLKTTYGANLYDLNLTIAGSYEAVYNFIYSIENDDDLMFEIVNLSITPYMKQTTITTTSSTGGSSSVTDYPLNGKETRTSTTIAGVEATTSATNSTNKTNGLTINQNNTNSTSASSSSGGTDVAYDPKNVQAVFTVKNVSISFE